MGIRKFVVGCNTDAVAVAVAYVVCATGGVVVGVLVGSTVVT